MKDLQKFHSSVLTSSSPSSFCTSETHPLAIGTERWQIVEKKTRELLCIIQPSVVSERRRKQIIEYIQTLFEDSYGIKVFPVGSVPLKTYLPDGDIDLTALSLHNNEQDLLRDFCNLLEREERENDLIQVRGVHCVPAQVKVVKCTVENVAVDISFNQMAGLCTLCFLDQVDHFIGKDHLFKRSVILIKAWCYYESRILGGHHGLISTYALETMILHVVNLFHSSLQCPLAVLYKFLEYYSTFDWESYGVVIDGLISLSYLPKIEVQLPENCDELLLTEDFLRSCREAFSVSTGMLETQGQVFPVKFLNILDPLRDDNNLGRSVSKANYYRIKCALSYGTQKLRDVLMLPPEKISEVLEKFFVNTLERNGRGRRADVLYPVPEFGTTNSVVSDANGDNGDLLAGIQYGLWFHDYGMIYPLQCNISSPQIWSNAWEEMHQNMGYDRNLYYEVNESPPSVDRSHSEAFPVTSTSCTDEKRRSRGTGTYIPQIEHLLRRDESLNESGGTVEIQDDVPTEDANPSTDFDRHRCCLNFSVEEFPFLPGSKPVETKVNQFGQSPKSHEPNDALTSPESIEFGSFKPESAILLEPGKQSDSDVLEYPPNDRTTIWEDQESPKSEEKIPPMRPFQLGDDNDFPPLAPSAKPENRTDDKEHFPPLAPAAKPETTIDDEDFPPLCVSVKSEKRADWRRKMDVHKGS